MQRPSGETAIAVIDFVGARVLILGGIAVCFGGAFIGAMIGGSASRTGAGAGLGMLIGAALGIVLLVFAAIAAVTGWGLWSLKEWARVTQIVLAALGILRTFFSIMSVFTHGHVFGIPFSLLWL